MQPFVNVSLSVPLACQVLKGIEGDRSGAAVLALEELDGIIRNALRVEGVEP